MIATLLRPILATAVLAATLAACAPPPPQADLSAPAARPLDAKTALESGRRR